MEKPYLELARLVGKMLAKRWLNRTTKQDTRPNSQPRMPKADSRNERLADTSEVSSDAV